MSRDKTLRTLLWKAGNGLMPPRSAVDETEVLLREAAVERGCRISGDGRVDEACAAALLGRSPRTLAWWRQTGTGPHCIRVGGRVTYRFRALAEFIHREPPE